MFKEFALLGVRFVDFNEGGIMVLDSLELSFVWMWNPRKVLIIFLFNWRDPCLEVHWGSLPRGDGVLLYQGCLSVPDVDNLMGKILLEAYSSQYSVHGGATKIYRDLPEVYL